MSVMLLGLGREARTDAFDAPIARRRRQRGSAIVEQAIALPVMVLLMFGIIDMSRALYAYHYVSYIAREATRMASVRSTGATGGPVDNAMVTAFVKDVPGMGLDSTKFTTDTQFLRPPSGTPLCPSAGNNTANRKAGCIVQVTVDYQFKFVVPIMPAGFTMSSESQMIITQ
jgi:Flp pilus assembly protein TadG